MKNSVITHRVLFDKYMQVTINRIQDVIKTSKEISARAFTRGKINAASKGKASGEHVPTEEIVSKQKSRNEFISSKLQRRDKNTYFR